MSEIGKCYKCGLVKPRTAFVADKSRSTGIASACKECNARDARRWRKEYGHARRFRASSTKSHLKREYSITLEEYDVLFEGQNRCCAICGKPERAMYRGSPRHLAVDHDHITGQIRGLLCFRCNILLGHVGEDVDLLLKHITYLRRHNAAQNRKET